METTLPEPRPGLWGRVREAARNIFTEEVPQPPTELSGPADTFGQQEQDVPQPDVWPNQQNINNVMPAVDWRARHQELAGQSVDAPNQTIAPQDLGGQGPSDGIAPTVNWVERYDELKQQRDPQVLAAQQTWEQSVMEINGSDRSEAEKAFEIQGLGQPPGLGANSIDEDEPDVARPGLQQAVEVAGFDVNRGLEENGDGLPPPDEEVNHVRDPFHSNMTLGEWNTPEAGVEYRVNHTFDDAGHYAAVEVSYNGADQGADYNGPFGTKEEAIDWANKEVDQQFYSLEREQEVGGYEL